MRSSGVDSAARVGSGLIRWLTAEDKIQPFLRMLISAYQSRIVLSGPASNPVRSIYVKALDAMGYLFTSQALIISVQLGLLSQCHVMLNFLNIHPGSLHETLKPNLTGLSRIRLSALG